MDWQGLENCSAVIHTDSGSGFNLCPRKFLALTREKGRTEPFFPDTVSVTDVKKKLVAMTFAVLHFQDLTTSPNSFHFQLQAQTRGLHAILNSFQNFAS